MNGATSRPESEFQPARSKLEAVTRLSALTQSPPESLGPGSKERKSVLVGLARGLDLTVDASATKPGLGAQIASALQVPWGTDCWSAGNTITLIGLNQLLSGAELEVAQRRAVPRPRLFEPVQPMPIEFIPARSKLEAVTRLSALTQSPPESLGPGSKERKSVMVNLARGLDLTADTNATKPELGSQIASALDVAWGSDCWSAGNTITLIGLNQLLSGSERRATAQDRDRSGVFFSAREEANALLETLALAMPPYMEGRTCAQAMKEAAFTQWRQTEWTAFYFEFIGLPALVNAFGGGPRVFSRTRFDYGLAHTWDLKVHMATSGLAPLNDCSGVETAVDSGTGVGFLILTGRAELDDGEFRAWHEDFRSQLRKRVTKRSAPRKYVRLLKSGFTPQMLEAFYLPDREALETALGYGAIKVMRQGAQTSGRPRPPKYLLDLVQARWEGGMLLSQRVLGTASPPGL
ncbi:MAG: hypothetical protein H0U16_03165 [Actinobacteria bacterium]|nr:hypothetical protein [Actinomycetota bacterium]